VARVPLPSLISIDLAGAERRRRFDKVRPSTSFLGSRGVRRVQLRLEVADFGDLDISTKVRPDKEFRAEVGGSAGRRRWKCWRVGREAFQERWYDGPR
jgi:hypothetical protein